jgi:PilZ domain
MKSNEQAFAERVADRMLLSAQMYQEILKSLRSDGGKSETRRKHARVGMRAKITIILLGKDGQLNLPESVWIRDISTAGIGLVTTKPIARGQLLVVQFNQHDENALSLLCQVVQCRKFEFMVIGAHILRPLTKDENSKVINRFPLVIEPDEIPVLGDSEEEPPE